MKSGIITYLPRVEDWEALRTSQRAVVRGIVIRTVPLAALALGLGLWPAIRMLAAGHTQAEWVFVLAFTFAAVWIIREMRMLRRTRRGIRESTRMIEKMQNEPTAGSRRSATT